MVVDDLTREILTTNPLLHGSTPGKLSVDMYASWVQLATSARVARFRAQGVILDLEPEILFLGNAPFYGVDEDLAGALSEISAHEIAIEETDILPSLDTLLVEVCVNLGTDLRSAVSYLRKTGFYEAATKVKEVIDEDLLACESEALARAGQLKGYLSGLVTTKPASPDHVAFFRRVYVEEHQEEPEKKKHLAPKKPAAKSPPKSPPNTISELVPPERSLRTIKVHLGDSPRELLTSSLGYALVPPLVGLRFPSVPEIIEHLKVAYIKQVKGTLGDELPLYLEGTPQGEVNGLLSAANVAYGTLRGLALTHHRRTDVHLSQVDRIKGDLLEAFVPLWGSTERFAPPSLLVPGKCEEYKAEITTHVNSLGVNSQEFFPDGIE